MSETPDKGLSGAFGDKGTNPNQMAYGHPNGKAIIDTAKAVIRQTETGAMLLKSCEMGRIPINIIKGLGEPGFSPDARIIYVQAAGKTLKADAKLILQLVKALRDADQDLLGVKAPDPNKDIMQYATVMHGKNMDAIIHVCKFVKELTNSSDFKDFLDALGELGYKKVYKVYAENGSEDDLFKAYASS